MSKSKSFWSHFCSTVKGILAKCLACVVCTAVGLTGGGGVGLLIGHNKGFSSGKSKGFADRSVDHVRVLRKVLQAYADAPPECRPALGRLLEDPLLLGFSLEDTSFAPASDEVAHKAREPAVPSEGETENELLRPLKAWNSRPEDAILSLLGIGTASAEAVPAERNLETVLKRMRQRSVQLAKYKAEGSVGENRRGYVQALDPRRSPRMSDRKYAAGAQAVVRAENADRRQLYRFRATRLGKKVEEVAAAEAKIRQAQAKRGEWIEVPANRRGTEWRWRKMR